MIDFDKILSDILRREGGYTNHPADRGGPTNYGITQARLQAWRGHPVTADDVKAMPESEARAIYQAEYLTAPGLYKIADPYLLSLCVDCAVNHGPGRAVRWLQQAAGVVDDGTFGPATEVAVNSQDAVRLYQRVLAKRIRFYGQILNNDHSQVVFAAGWLNRAAEFVEV